MNKQPINKDVTEKDLEEINKSFLELENKIKDVCKLIFSQEKEQSKFFKSSHYILSIANRAISLNRGFLTLTQVNNYSTAISLIRLQVDSCLRLFALTLVDDWPSFYKDVVSGKEIRNLKDRYGNKMIDSYLVDKYDKIDNGFKLLYKNTCGFVHFSNAHIKLNTKTKDETEDTFRMQVSVGDVDQLEVYEKVDYGFNMFMVGKSIYKQIKSYQKAMKEHWLN